MQTEKYCEFQAKVSFFSYFKFVTKIFVSEISKDLTWGTQGREEGRWVSVSNDCCCEDSTGAADYSKPATPADIGVNDYDGKLYYECPTNQSITRIISQHDTDFVNTPNSDDRIWGFECSPSQFSLETCSWSGYVNNYDELLVYQCSSGAGVIAGMESVHDDSSEDRRSGGCQLQSDL